MTTALLTAWLESPLGAIRIIGSPAGIREVAFEDALPDDPGPVPPELTDAVTQLAEYFGGTRTEFALALDMHGTDFEQRVWRHLLTIPFGETRSYGEVAAALGDIKATRAVGRANGRNPIAIVVPCHRVIGASGELTGYGGGLWRKEWLLTHEGRPTQPRLF